MKPVRVLMTGGGAPGAAGIIKCLRQLPGIEITTVDMRSNVVGEKLADHFFVVPPARDSEAFLNRISDLVREQRIDLVLPLVTAELLLLSRHKTQIERLGAKVLVSDFESLTIANNKLDLMNHLKNNGVPTAEFIAVNTKEAFVEAVRALGYPNRSVCFKPAVSNGSRGFRILDDTVSAFDLLFNEKPNTTYSSLEKVLDAFGNHPLPTLVVMETLPGDEYSVDCVVRGGEVFICVPRRRSKTLGGISVEGEFVHNHEIVEYTQSVLRTLNLFGNIGVQVKLDRNNNPKILEINPRVQGTISSNLGMGLNLPLMGLNLALGKPIEGPKPNELPWGTKFVRHWEELFFEP